MIAAPLLAAEAILTVSNTNPRKRFPRSARVRTRAEYTAIFDAARRYSEPLMSLHWCRGDSPARLGLAVSRKVDRRAVGRNRIKRVLRDTMRQFAPWMVDGDYVIVARSAAATASNLEVRDAFLRLLRRAGALPLPAADGTMPPPVGAASSLSLT